MAGIAMIASIATVFVSGRLICEPYVNTVLRMEALADGDTESMIHYTDYSDCVGRMTKAMAVFRDNSVKLKTVADITEMVVSELATGLEALAGGNLTYKIDRTFPDEYERLRLSFNQTVEGLDTSLDSVTKSASSVNSGSAEIRSASEDLAHRTEQQAASLEETTAAMNSVTEMVAETARSAGQVRNAVLDAHKDAIEGGDVVRSAVEAMNAIESSSQEINQIISVIDGISFQTNLLALNAGVEAARAGDAGKGFAVVANEVRALARRSADAAKSIKDLITNSTNQVTTGVELVSETGRMLGRIAGRIDEITKLVGDIASGTEAQSTNLQQVNAAVNDMDRMTQQNAAMVEESTAASRSLAAESDELAELVSRFQLKGGARHSRSVASPTSVQLVAAPATRSHSVVSGNLALAVEADWSEF